MSVLNGFVSFGFRLGGDMLEPDAVAQAIVDGMRRDNRYVYLTPHMETITKIVQYVSLVYSYVT